MSERYAIIENDLVTNICIGKPAAKYFSVRSSIAQIGWLYEDGILSPPPKTPETPLDAKSEQYYAAVAAGYPDTEEGITLALWDYDRAQFGDYIDMIQEGIALGAITGAVEDTITDIDGAPHRLSISRIRALLFRYGMYYKTILWNQAHSGT